MAQLKNLKLSIARLDWLLLVSRLFLHNLLIAAPIHSFQALRQNWVRVVEAGIEPVGVHARKILDLQFDERSSKLAGISKLHSECIYT